MKSLYITPMFPYPSGSGLHAGHWYNYSILDSYCRYKRFIGTEVFQPFGYDSFGLPAENYAKKIGGDPREITYKNIEKFREQIGRMNTQYEELLVTSDNSFQEHSKWLFTKLYEHGLAYKKKGSVDYCPNCDTTLAREQVKDGSCDRCGTHTEKKILDQWYFRTTAYAERLYQNLTILDYPKTTINAQREWIGRSEGYEIDFGNGIIVFTTKPETILDVKFIVTISENGKEEFTGKYGICPITKNKIPVFTSLYVIEGYGTGYVMGVPNDDKRDRDFAVRHGIEFEEEHHTTENIDEFSTKKINYKLHDWCISRQRKWGCPIPLDGETDTMDTFVDSSIYLIVYCIIKGIKPRPVDIYVGGKEHACMHLIYVRFITMFLYDIGFIDFEEPIIKLVHQGMITNKGEKMSKSKDNTVSLDEYDSDIIRFYLSFIGHYFDGGAWTGENINGVIKFVNRMKVWFSSTGEETIDLTKFKETIFGYTESFKFNKVVSSFMILFNDNKNKNLNRNCKSEILDLLEIYMPNIKSKIVL